VPEQEEIGTAVEICLFVLDLDPEAEGSDRRPEEE
jgi:hypothetical protein